ncbi:uncharacterized protein JCM15063_005484 [Sporobolomyces koalae]|uniref:uncharacterized protein n=1 Tax=Sporobolomyces koalae TaxID=500713 RepID=UPI003171757F
MSPINNDNNDLGRTDLSTFESRLHLATHVTLSESEKMDPIPTLFAGQHPYLDHAKALARAKRNDNIESNEQDPAASDKNVEQLVEIFANRSQEFVNQFDKIVQTSRELFQRSLIRQQQLESELSNHSGQLELEDKQLKETKDQLEQWTRQLVVPSVNE